MTHELLHLVGVYPSTTSRTSGVVHFRHFPGLSGIVSPNSAPPVWRVHRVVLLLLLPVPNKTVMIRKSRSFVAQQGPRPVAISGQVLLQPHSVKSKRDLKHIQHLHVGVTWLEAPPARTPLEGPGIACLPCLLSLFLLAMASNLIAMTSFLVKGKGPILDGGASQKRRPGSTITKQLGCFGKGQEKKREVIKVIVLYLDYFRNQKEGTRNHQKLL